LGDAQVRQLQQGDEKVRRVVSTQAFQRRRRRAAASFPYRPPRFKRADLSEILADVTAEFAGHETALLSKDVGMLDAR
jgi:hypothetical protein